MPGYVPIISIISHVHVWTFQIGRSSKEHNFKILNRLHSNYFALPDFNSELIPGKDKHMYSFHGKKADGV